MTSIKECALCGHPITNENDSKEHIIPNAIGGRKKVSGFICEKCNNEKGKDWDSDLAHRLNPLSVLFGISRERGEPPPHIVETKNGEQLRLYPDGSMEPAKPKYEETQNESGIKINIVVRSKEELKKILHGVKRKYPKTDIDKIMSDFQLQEYYPESMIDLKMPSFGGAKAGKSIVKTCLALAVESGINPKSCKQAIDYLTKPDGEPCFGYYYERDLILNRPADIVFHCISITGNPDAKQLLGYVEYYGAWRMIVCLSDEYEGEKFTHTYALNPVSGQKVELIIDISSLSKEEITAAYRNEKVLCISLTRAFERTISIGQKQSFQKEMHRVINKSVKYAFDNCGAEEGDNLNEEQIAKAQKLLIEGIRPFIIHHLRRPNK
jgi:hypothetical protein